jgi:stearoyl-CoA desaturase (delta-9 desaturase)
MLLTLLGILLVFIIFALHWYSVILMQSFLDHRIASHRHYIVSPFVMKVLVFISWLVSGTSYLSPYYYAILHRLHHRYADIPGKDPHTPKKYAHLKGFFGQTRGFFLMMWDTFISYNKIKNGTYDLSNDQCIFDDPIPRWQKFDDFASNWVTRIVWIPIYAFVYWNIYRLWESSLWVLIPAIMCFIGSCIMNPLHGALVNWISHKIGTRPYNLGRITATNFVGGMVDFLLFGEFYHNHHHHDQDKVDFADKGKGEKGYDILYQKVARPLIRLGVIKLRKPAAA